jgi:hypothetical protein
MTGAPASAAPSWLAPVKLSAPPNEAETPRVAADGRGDDVAVWRRFDLKAGHYVIEAAGRPAGGAWQTPAVISSSSEAPSLPQVALDSGGDAVAVWLGHGSEYSIQAAARAGVSGAWSVPQELKGLGATPVTEPRPDLAMNSHGDAVAAWEVNAGVHAVLEASVWTGGAWGSAETISTEAVDLHPAEVGIDAAGDATAAWEQEAEGFIRATVSTRPAGGKWQAPLALSETGGQGNEPRLAENPGGEAVVIWERLEGEEFVEAAGRAGVSGPWSKPVKLSRKEASKGEPGGQQVALDGHGDAVAVWSRFEGTEDIVEAAAGRAATASWGAPKTISGKGRNVEEEPEVAVDESGDAVAVWPQWNGASEVIQGVAGSAVSGGWGTPAQVSANGEDADQAGVAIDAQGDAAAVWLRFDETSKVILAESAGYDAAGPVLNGLSVPAFGTVGQPLSFSVTPFDAWSALGATTWSFGDGASASGSGVTHAYTTPGTYTVTVTSLDALGNASSAQAAVSIRSVVPALCACLQTVAPRVTHASLTHTHFRVSKRPTAIFTKAKPPQGTSFHFTLSEPAAVKIAFERAATGLRSGHSCLAPSARLRRKHAKHCPRTVQVGGLIRSHEAQGPDSIAFSGRLGTKPLSPGTYRAIITATAAGVISAPLTLAFTVLA